MIAKNQSHNKSEATALTLELLDTLTVLKRNAALLEAYETDEIGLELKGIQLKPYSEGLIDIYISRRDVFTDVIEQKLRKLLVLLQPDVEMTEQAGIAESEPEEAQ